MQANQQEFSAKPTMSGGDAAIGWLPFLRE
jgi:hypothetical protein